MCVGSRVKLLIASRFVAGCVQDRGALAATLIESGLVGIGSPIHLETLASLLLYIFLQY